MNVYVLSKDQFDALMIRQHVTNDNVELKTDAFLISINSTEDCDSTTIPYFKEDKTNLKIMFFDDVDRDIYQTKVTIINGKKKFIEDKSKLQAKAITDKQAKELVEFIQKNKDKKMCIIHCTAGISRSGAVGEFINDLYGVPHEQFRKINPYIHPNIFIKNKLKQYV